MTTLYAICPGDEFDPSVNWVDEAWDVLHADAQHADWNLRHLSSAVASAVFDVRNVYAVIARDVGPVLLLGQLSTACVGGLQEKLAHRAVSQWCRDADDSTAVYEAMLDLIRRHATGEPEMSRRHAVAVMLVAKLEHMHYWGGNAKGFMTVQKLAKSNGLDEKYKATACEVAQYLAASQRGIRLLSKKTGDGYEKYACNNDDRAIVYEFLKTWRVSDEQLMNWLTRDPARVSIRELDEIRARNYDASR